MFGKPKYSLIKRPVPQGILDENPNAICGELVGEGPFAHVVILFDAIKFSETREGVKNFAVEFDIIALPESLMKHKQDIIDGRGKTYKSLMKEVNKVTSYIITEVVNEIKKEQESNGKPA